MSITTDVTKELRSYVDAEKAALYPKFFKTGKGEYGEGDIFLGVTVPNSRLVAKQFSNATEAEIEELLESEFHEVRLVGLVILTERFRKAKSEKLRQEIFDLYMVLVYKQQVNNWDLIDVTASVIGANLYGKKTELLDELCKSESLWERRVSIMLTFALIRAGQFEPTLRIAKKLLGDKHDLIHKATGWMLREVGNRDVELLRGFLRQHVKQMPRTMLRYSIEKLSPQERSEWMTR